MIRSCPPPSATAPSEVSRSAPGAVRPGILLACLLACCAGRAAAEVAPTPLTVDDPESTIGCRQASGTFLVVLEPELGTVLLSRQDFPDSSPAGSIADGALRIELPGFQRVVRTSAPASSGPLHGRIDRALEVDRRGCVSFDHQRFTSVGDLATYVRWLVRDLALAIPAEAWAPERALELRQRRIVLEVDAEGAATTILATEEAAAVAFDLPGAAQGRLLLLPLVLDPEIGAVAIKLQSASGPFFDTAPKPELGFVIASPEQPALILGEPRVAIRVREVGAASE